MNRWFTAAAASEEEGVTTPALATPAVPTPTAASPAPAWENVRPQQELQAALDAAAAAQRSATAAEQQAAQQQASFALTLRREREKMRAEHQAAVAQIWQQVGDADLAP